MHTSAFLCKAATAVRDGTSTERRQSAVRLNCRLDKLTVGGTQFSREISTVTVQSDCQSAQSDCDSQTVLHRAVLGPLAHPHSILGHHRSYARSGRHGQCFHAHLHSSGRYARSHHNSSTVTDCQFSPTVSIRLAVENWQSTTGSRAETVGLNWQSVTVELAVGSRQVPSLTAVAFTLQLEAHSG